MKPFTYERASDAQAAARAVTSQQNAKFIAGGTNLVDLMKMNVERPARLIDISRLPLDQVEETAFEVYSLDDGSHVRIEAAPWEFGWTAGGDLYRVDASALQECDATTGACTDVPLPAGTTLGDNVVLGGRYYES